ncbi:MAG TPA: hypothetical protein VGP68_16150 [Gemmataceae bacterium]|nr:hypothetical protein [Gemmataceae bacterium]
MSDPATPYRPRCVNLSCKSMMVYGEAFENDPEFQAGMVEFWCVLTSKGVGPDSADAELDACSSPDRACFQAF